MSEFIVERGSEITRKTFDKEEITIGREADNDLVIEDQSVSRRHAVVQKGDTGWFVKDLGSGNGTFVGADRVMKAGLDRGTVFSVGDAKITFLGDTPKVAAPLGAAPAGGGATAAGEAAADPVAAATLAPAIEGWEAMSHVGEDALFSTYSYRKVDGGPLWAFRIVRGAWAEDAEVVSWIEEATRRWNEVDHPALVRLGTLATDDGHLVLKERLSEETLTTKVRSSPKNKLSQEETLRLGARLGRAIGELHDADHVHGALHPDLVRYDADGELRLSGPGWPKKVVERAGDDVAASLSCVAPEAFLEEGVVGRRSDIWGLGAVMHFALLGAPLGEGNKREGVERAVVRGMRRTPKERRPELVDGVSEILESMLQLDPADRPKKPEDLVVQFEYLATVAKKRSSVDPKRMQGRERQLGERQEAPRKSLQFRLMSWTVTLLIFILLNMLLYFFVWG